jgi:flagellar motor switch protein FliM
MTKQSSQVSRPIDRVVLARLTGNLGDAKTVARCCSDVAALHSQLLGEMIREEMQLELDIEFLEHRSGLNSTLIEDLGAEYTLTSATLRNWCPHFVLGTKNDLAIAMIAQLLGDASPQGGGGESRPLSSIEADIAALVFNKIASVLRSGLSAPGNFEPVLSSPYPAGEYAQHAAEVVDDFAAAIKLQVTLGALVSEIVLVIPQNVLLKTTIVKPTAQLADGREADERLTDRILRSQVDLCARIKLTPLKLSSIARLRPGDIIPFEDLGEVSVDMDANGKMMYRCEFGRSGDSYSVKVKSNSNPEGTTLKQILDI